MSRKVGLDGPGPALLNGGMAWETVTPTLPRQPGEHPPSGPGRAVPRLVSGMLGALLATCGPSLAQQVPTVGDAVEVQGEVLVTSHGDMAPRSLSQGDRLFEGDRIETGRDSRVRVLLEDGSLVQVGGSSALELEWVLYAPALDSRNVILNVPAGIVRFLVEALVPRSSFEVKTGTAVSSAQSADWIVATDGETTWVIALEGEVMVENVRPDVIGKVVLVGSERTLVPAGEPPGSVEPLPDERREVYLGRTGLR